MYLSQKMNELIGSKSHWRSTVVQGHMWRKFGLGLGLWNVL